MSRPRARLSVRACGVGFSRARALGSGGVCACASGGAGALDHGIQTKRLRRRGHAEFFWQACTRASKRQSAPVDSDSRGVSGTYARILGAH